MIEIMSNLLYEVVTCMCNWAYKKFLLTMHIVFTLLNSQI